jgi:hypothetical protein
MKKFLLFFSLSGIIILLTVCKHTPDLSLDPPFPVLPPIEDSSCSPTTVYFQNSVLPVVNSGCAKSGCHDEATHKSGLTLTNYSQIMDLVSPSSPQDSKLYKVLFSNNEVKRMPPEAPLPDNQKSIIYYWIKQGAQNNSCECSGFDTLNVTYSTSIKPIIDNWCVNCHGGSSPSNSMPLETKDEVIGVANGGRLMGALHHETGFYPMPNGFMLSNCSIGKFQVWVDNPAKP